MDARTVTALLDGEPLVVATRGGTPESVHRIAVCAMNSGGDVAYAAGTIDAPVFLRSTAKPFIAACIVASGAAERFHFDPPEIAAIAGSHNGTPAHVEVVRSMLHKLGVSEDALRCGSHPPYDADAARALERRGTAPSAVHNNCSGKHAGMLALARVLGDAPESYLDAASATQREILAFCAALCGRDPSDLATAVDGCGMPVFAVGLRDAARAFVRLATLQGCDARTAAALRIVREAMIAHPFYVGGRGEFDTMLMHAGDKSVAAKAGAEGVFGIADASTGTGLVLKVIDGASRAVPPFAMALLADLGLLGSAARAQLRAFAQPPLYNRSGSSVGRLEATASRHATNRST